MSVFHEPLDSFPVPISLLSRKYSRSRGTQGPPQHLVSSPAESFLRRGLHHAGDARGRLTFLLEHRILQLTAGSTSNGLFSHPLSTGYVTLEAAHRSFCCLFLGQALLPLKGNCSCRGLSRAQIHSCSYLLKFLLWLPVARGASPHL